MNILNFPKRKPTADQLALPIAMVSACGHEVSVQVLKALNDIMAAYTADELAVAISGFHGVVAEANAQWAQLADITRNWSRPPR